MIQQSSHALHTQEGLNLPNLACAVAVSFFERSLRNRVAFARQMERQRETGEPLEVRAWIADSRSPRTCAFAVRVRFSLEGKTRRRRKGGREGGTEEEREGGTEEGREERRKLN